MVDMCDDEMGFANSNFVDGLHTEFLVSGVSAVVKGWTGGARWSI